MMKLTRVIAPGSLQEETDTESDCQKEGNPRERRPAIN